MLLPPIVSAKTSLGLGHGAVRGHPHRHVRNQERAEDERVAEEEDPHHRLAPGDVLERPLVRRPVGDDALHALGQRSASAVLVERRLRHVARSSLVDGYCSSTANKTAQTRSRIVPVHACTAPRSSGPCRRSTPRSTLAVVLAQTHRPPSRCKPCNGGEQRRRTRYAGLAGAEIARGVSFAATPRAVRPEKRS